MITLEQLKELANKMEDKSIEAKDAGRTQEATGILSTVIELWKFINAEQLKQLS